MDLDFILIMMTALAAPYLRVYISTFISLLLLSKIISLVTDINHALSFIPIFLIFMLITRWDKIKINIISLVAKINHRYQNNIEVTDKVGFVILKFKYLGQNQQIYVKKYQHKNNIYQLLGYDDQRKFIEIFDNSIGNIQLDCPLTPEELGYSRIECNYKNKEMDDIGQKMYEKDDIIQVNDFVEPPKQDFIPNNFDE